MQLYVYWRQKKKKKKRKKEKNLTERARQKLEEADLVSVDEARNVIFWPHPGLKQIIPAHFVKNKQTNKQKQPNSLA